MKYYSTVLTAAVAAFLQTSTAQQLCVETEAPYDAGFGGCSTYAAGLINNGFCDQDVDSNGILAQDACAECGVCVTDTTPLTNDLCEGALPLESFQTGSTVSATIETVGFCGTDNTAAGVWYTVSGISGPITVDTCSSFSNFDTKISVFQGSCGGLTCVDGNDDDFSCSLNGLHSSVTWTATASEQYFVLVHGFGIATGEFGLNAALPSGPPVPPAGTPCIETEAPFNAGFGDCSTYAEGLINNGFCSTDVDSNGVVAQDACAECGVCVEAVPSVETPCIETEAPFDAGFGDCSTYAEGLINNGFCSTDVDSNGVVAQDACAECGVCVSDTAGPAVPPAGAVCVETDAPFDAGFGDCSTYAEGLINNGFCLTDVDSNGVVAADACAECGQCI